MRRRTAPATPNAWSGLGGNVLTGSGGTGTGGAGRAGRGGGDRRYGWQWQQGRRRWHRGSGRRREWGTANGHVRRPLPERRGLQRRQLHELDLLHGGLLDVPDLRQLGDQLHQRYGGAGSARRLPRYGGVDLRLQRHRVQRLGSLQPLRGQRQMRHHADVQRHRFDDSVFRLQWGRQVQSELSGELQRLPLPVERLLDQLHGWHLLRHGRILRCRDLRRRESEPGGQRRSRVRHHRRVVHDPQRQRAFRDLHARQQWDVLSRADDRTATYIGPGYYIPTGIGQYNVSLWAMQNQVAAGLSGLLQLRLNCATGTYYYAGNLPVQMPSGVWVNVTGTIDLNVDTAVLSDCFASPKTTGVLPGLVRTAAIFLNENMDDQPVPDTTIFPNFYVDDLVVTVTDGHNLVGNPNFEAAGGYCRRVNASVYGLGVAQREHGPAQRRKNSLWLHSRSTWNMAIRYAIAHRRRGLRCHFLRHAVGGDCARRPAVGGLQLPWQSPVPARSRTKAITQTAQLATGNWLPLSSGAVAFPPSDAPKACEQMTGAAFWVTQADQGTCGTGSGQLSAQTCSSTTQQSSSPTRRRRTSSSSRRRVRYLTRGGSRCGGRDAFA